VSKILVIDDDPMLIEGVCSLLELHGLASVSASHCDAAEQLMAAEFFPIILSDLRMRTDDDGFRMLDAVRRISPRSRVATMTGYADAATEARLRERGAHLVLHKPFDEHDLMAALRSMLEVVEAAEAEQGDDLDALYTTTLDTLQAVARGRFGFTTEDTEELVQEAWLLYLEKRRDVRTPKAWLSGTVANLCRQEIGRRTRDRARSAEIPVIAVPRNDDDVLAIRQALAKLDDRSRMLCTTIGMEQRTYDEVSASAAIPIGSVGPLYMRAKEKLRMAL
jgi:DNA-directed RNA polymerase specialized sigma24 family protein